MELINKKDAVHAVLHNQGDAAVAAVQNIKPITHSELREMLIKDGHRMANADLIIELTYCASIEKRKLLSDAAAAIEQMTTEIDRKDKSIQGLLTQIESKDKAIERMRDLMRHYKAAYRTAYKLYQEARK